MIDCNQKLNMKASTSSIQCLKVYAKLMRLHKPIGIFLLMWPMLWTLWIAGRGYPSIVMVVIFLMGCILMRSAGCVINDVADRHWDGHVKRTKNRPLVMGQVTVKEAYGLALMLSLMAFGLVCCTNLHTVKLSVVALALAALYPFTKRITYWPQLFLGLAFAWAVPMSYSALQVPMNLTTLLLYIATVVWALAYDTAYAMVDRMDDSKLAIKSTALRLGRWDRLFIALMHSLLLILFAWIALRESLGRIFYLSWSVAWMLVIYQQILIRHREANACLKAFLHNHYVGLCLFLGICCSQR